MMKSTIVLGIVLIALGTAGLVYKEVSYTSKETVAKIGPLEATADTTKDVPIPKVLSIVSIVLGVGAVLVAVKK